MRETIERGWEGKSQNILENTHHSARTMRKYINIGKEREHRWVRPEARCAKREIEGESGAEKVNLHSHRFGWGDRGRGSLSIWDPPQNPKQQEEARGKEESSLEGGEADLSSRGQGMKDAIMMDGLTKATETKTDLVFLMRNTYLKGGRKTNAR